MDDDQLLKALDLAEQNALAFVGRATTATDRGNRQIVVTLVRDAAAAAQEVIDGHEPGEADDARCICTVHDDPNDHRKDCPEWGVL